jgi:hypothetical protein
METNFQTLTPEARKALEDRARDTALANTVVMLEVAGERGLSVNIKTSELTALIDLNAKIAGINKPQEREVSNGFKIVFNMPAMDGEPAKTITLGKDRDEVIEHDTLAIPPAFLTNRAGNLSLLELDDE